MQIITENQEQITSVVNRVMVITSITVETQKDNILANYRGQLRKDSEQAYDQLAAALLPYKITPLFREEQDQHLIIQC